MDISINTGNESNNMCAIVIHGSRILRRIGKNINHNSKINLDYINRFSKFLEDYYQKVFVINYEDDDATENNLKKLYTMICEDIDDGFNVDVFGHSKGGLLAVGLSINYPIFSKKINRIFTICTPFKGAKIATYEKVLGNFIKHFNKSKEWISNIFSKTPTESHSTFPYKNEELLDPNDPKSFLFFINNNLDNLSPDIEYITIGTWKDSTVPVKNSILDCKLPNVKNLIYDSNNENENFSSDYYSHTGTLEHILFNSLNDLLISLIKTPSPKNDSNRIFDEKYKEFHFFEDCRIKDIPLLNKYENSYIVCKECVEISRTLIYKNNLIKGSELSERVLFVFIDDEGNESFDVVFLLKRHLRNISYYDAVYFINVSLLNSDKTIIDIIDFFINPNLKFDLLICDNAKKTIEFFCKFVDEISLKKIPILKSIFINTKTDYLKLNHQYLSNTCNIFLNTIRNNDIDKFMTVNNIIMNFNFENSAQRKKMFFESNSIFTKMDTNGFIELLEQIMRTENWNNPNHLFHFLKGKDGCGNNDRTSKEDPYRICLNCLIKESNLK